MWHTKTTYLLELVLEVNNLLAFVLEWNLINISLGAVCLPFWLVGWHEIRK